MHFESFLCAWEIHLDKQIMFITTGNWDHCCPLDSAVAHYRKFASHRAWSLIIEIGVLAMLPGCMWADEPACRDLWARRQYCWCWNVLTLVGLGLLVLRALETIDLSRPQELFAQLSVRQNETSTEACSAPTDNHRGARDQSHASPSGFDDLMRATPAAQSKPPMSGALFALQSFTIPSSHLKSPIQRSKLDQYLPIEACSTSHPTDVRPTSLCLREYG